MSKLNGWDSEEEIFDDFRATRPADCEIIFAAYDQGNYEGEALVLFRSEGKLFEVNGGHCSCYGLEGQWEPEETTVADLRHRIENGRVIFRQELVAALDLEEAQNAKSPSPGDHEDHLREGDDRFDAEELRLLRGLEANRREHREFKKIGMASLPDLERYEEGWLDELDRHREGR